MARSFLTAALIILLPASALSADNEAYYSADLDDAVAAAKRNPVNDAYVGARWYNRTTSRSFALPRMLNTEMDREVIEGAMGPTAAGEAAATEAQQPVLDASLGRQSRNSALQETTNDTLRNEDPDKREGADEAQDFFIRESRSESSVARNIRGTGISVKAYPRP